MFIRLRCIEDQIFWLGGWASQWRPPHIHHGAEQMISQSPWKGGSLDCLTVSAKCVCGDDKRFKCDDLAEISFFRGFCDRNLWTMIKKTSASFPQRSPPNQNVVRGVFYQGQEINSQMRSLEVLYVTPSTLTKAPSTVIQTPRV
jgi:hypothetical protein